MKNKKSQFVIRNYKNSYPDITKNLVSPFDSLNANFRGLNSSLLRALNITSNLQYSIFRNTNLTILPSTNFFAKKKELRKGVLPKTINSSLIVNCNYQKTFLSTLKAPAYLKLIKPKLFEPNSKVTQLIYTVPNIRNNFKYDQMISSVKNSMRKYQNTIDSQKFIPRFPKELFYGIEKSRIMSVARLYQPIDFRIPNITKEIIDRTETIINSEGVSVIDDLPEEMIIPDTDIRTDKEQPNIYYSELLDIIAGYIKSTVDEKFDKKIQVKGKTGKISNFLHTYPNFVRNTTYVLLISYMFISDFNNICNVVERIIQILKMLLKLIN